MLFCKQGLHYAGPVLFKRYRPSEGPFHADGDKVVADTLAQQHRKGNAPEIGPHESQRHDDGIAYPGNECKKAHHRPVDLQAAVRLRELSVLASDIFFTHHGVSHTAYVVPVHAHKTITSLHRG